MNVLRRIHFNNRFAIHSWHVSIVLTYLLTSGCSEAQTPVGTAQKSRSHSGVSSDAHQLNSPDGEGIPLLLTDVTDQSGVDATYKSGRALTILETVGGGVGLIDLDRDGLLDAVFPGGGTVNVEDTRTTGSPVKLFRNLGSLEFKRVRTEMLASNRTDYSHGCITPDLNNDGFPDILITCFGQDEVWLNNGDGSFAMLMRTKGKHRSEFWSTAAAALDADADGDLDLYITRYLDWQISKDDCLNPDSQKPDVCPPLDYPPGRDVLLINDDLALSPAENLPDTARTGRGLGTIAADINSDGSTDIYVANDAGPNHLYLGNTDGRFEECARWAGVSGNEFGANEGSMGVDAADLNGDGICDLWTTNFEYEDNSLYLGSQDQLFEHSTIAMNLAGPAKQYVGFGTRLVDLDLDGWEDILLVNGHVYYGESATGYQQPPLAFRNQAGAAFKSWKTSCTWFQSRHPSRGLATGDLDNNGTTDIVVVQQNARCTLLRNDTNTKWIRIKLTGTTSNRDAIGAFLTINTPDRRIRRWVTSGSGYLSQSDLRITLPAALVQPETLIHVAWPGGRKETFSGLVDGITNTLIQGSGAL